MDGTIGFSGRTGVQELRSTELLPRHDGHHQVEQDHGGAARTRLAQRLQSVAHAGGVVTLLRKRVHNEVPDVAVVIDDEDMASRPADRRVLLDAESFSDAGGDSLLVISCITRALTMTR